MGDWSKNFNKAEFKCPCCSKFIQNSSLITMLQIIRDEIQKPIRINSGTRCINYNMKLSGSSAVSAHMKGEAADFYISGLSNTEVYKLIKDLYAKGKIPQLTYCYKITGKSKTAVHVGVDKRARKSIWGSG